MYMSVNLGQNKNFLDRTTSKLTFYWTPIILQKQIKGEQRKNI